MVAVTGAHAASFGRNLDPTQLIRSTTDGVLEDAGIDREEIDALVVANAAAEAFNDVGNVSVWTATEARLAGVPTWRVDTGPSSGLAALATARGLASAPSIDTVLVLGWEAMTAVPTAQATEILGQLMADDERDHGLSLPGLVAMLTSAYLARYDRDVEELARASVKAHELASRNPIAQFDEPVTVEEVQASRLIADPLRLLHCAPLTDGAAAVVLEQEGDVELTAMGAATAPLGYAQRRSPPHRFAATRQAAKRAFQAADVGREAIDVVELHDAFSVLEAVNLEDLGFAAEGEGFDHLPAPGEHPLAPRPAVNPSGGLKARGHPVGATGLAQTVEAVDQLLGRAANPVEDARRALVHSIGGFGNNVHVALMEGPS